MVEDAAKIQQTYFEGEEDAAHHKASRKQERQALVDAGELSSSSIPPDEVPLGTTYTVSEAIDHMGFGPFQLLLLFYSGLAWASDAMEMMLLSFLGPAVRCGWDLSATQESLISSVVFLGTLLGANTWGMLSDAKGRRVGFQACAVFTFIFGLASAAAPSYGWLLAARFVVGIGLGGVPVAFALFAEFCPVRGRGAWLIALQVFWTFGSMAEAAIAWRVLVPLGWRVLLVLSALPFVLLMVLYPLLPESPHYLAVQGELLKAEAVLQLISRLNKRPLPPGTLARDGAREAAAKLADEEQGGGGVSIPLSETAQPPAASGSAASHSPGHPAISSDMHSSACAHEDSSQQRLQALRQRIAAALHPTAVREKVVAFFGTIRNLVGQLFAPSLRRTTLLLLLIWWSCAVAYYGLVLLATTMHVSDKHSACRADGHVNLTSEAFQKIFITSTAELPGMLLAAVLVELFSRKRVLAAALALTAVCVAMLAAIPADGSDALLSLFLWGSRGGIMAAFSCLFIYTPEVYPTSVRSVGMGVANGFSRIGAIMAPFIAVALVQAGQLTVAEALFALFCVAAAVATLLLPIETKGRALQATVELAEMVPAELVPQLQRESPQHSSVFQANAAAAGFSISPHSDSDDSAFSLGSASDDGLQHDSEHPRVGLLRPGTHALSDGPLAESRD